MVIRWDLFASSLVNYLYIYIWMIFKFIHITPIEYYVFCVRSWRCPWILSGIGTYRIFFNGLILVMLMSADFGGIIYICKLHCSEAPRCSWSSSCELSCWFQTLLSWALLRMMNSLLEWYKLKLCRCKKCENLKEVHPHGTCMLWSALMSVELSKLLCDAMS